MKKSYLLIGLVILFSILSGGCTSTKDEIARIPILTAQIKSDMEKYIMEYGFPETSNFPFNIFEKEIFTNLSITCNSYTCSDQKFDYHGTCSTKSCFLTVIPSVSPKFMISMKITSPLTGIQWEEHCYYATSLGKNLCKSIGYSEKNMHARPAVGVR